MLHDFRIPYRVTSNGHVSYLTATDYFSREIGPARIWPDGSLMYVNCHGQWHRTDGPAIIVSDGGKEYWIDGHELSVDEFFLKYGVV